MRFFLLCFFCLVINQLGCAQERVRNVRIRVVDSSSLDIGYDLLLTRPGDSIYLQMRSRLRGTVRVLPEFVRGDIGTGITAGSERHIYWDALANGYSLNEEVQAKVIVKTGTTADRVQPATPEPVITQAPAATEPPRAAPKPAESVAATTPKPTPPTAATLTPQPEAQRIPPSKPKPPGLAVDSAAAPIQPTPSAVAVAPVPPPSSTTAPPRQNQPASTPPTTIVADTTPVRKPHRRYAGPAWALLSAVAPGVGNIFVQTPRPKVGLRPLLAVLCYGAVAYGISERQKAADEYSIYEQQKNVAAGEPYYQTANNLYHRYYLATRGAAVVAAADIILTFVKGLRNSQPRKQTQLQGVTLQPGWLAGQPTAVLRYSF